MKVENIGSWPEYVALCERLQKTCPSIKRSITVAIDGVSSVTNNFEEIAEPEPEVPEPRPSINSRLYGKFECPEH